jgi:hypothetical protein
MKFQKESDQSGDAVYSDLVFSPLSAFFDFIATGDRRGRHEPLAMCIVPACPHSRTSLYLGKSRVAEMTLSREDNGEFRYLIQPLTTGGAVCDGDTWIPMTIPVDHKVWTQIQDRQQSVQAGRSDVHIETRQPRSSHYRSKRGTVGNGRSSWSETQHRPSRDVYVRRGDGAEIPFNRDVRLDLPCSIL